MSSTTRKRAVRAVAPVAGLLAAGLLVWQGSYAAFSSTTINNDDAWATGTMTLENNGGNGVFAGSTTVPLFNVNGIEPGNSGSGCITVRNTGSEGGDLRFFATGLTDTSAGGVLGNQIRLTVTQLQTATAIPADCTGFSGGTTVLSSTALTGLPATFGTSAATNITVADASAPVVYKFDWTFVSSASDNALKGQTATIDFNWELQGN